MHIIITHEQADFDAIASLLGAFLLNKDAQPILPRRYNRNVRDFIELYKSDLPFAEAKEIASSAIETITIVDTQSLVTPKGMNEKTSIHVIDHHTLRPNLPSEWCIFIHEMGSCATIFVESIKEQNIRLNVIQATLLLLGIYEDTGSLTYIRTTPRDVKAAAFLMENGASLQIAGNYLNPPLSKEQRKLYNRLLTRIESYNFHNLEIILATGNALDMNDEVSSVAHKLRDLLDPDGLILVIATSDGVRLVARSTSNQVDVSAITSYFGGGGHKRAAAALIRSNSIPPGDHISPVDYVHDELVKILPEFIHPAITVDQIMSPNPMLLNPDQSAKEAAHMMQRYGYEGYPVIDNHRVVGLLIRRAVDRALSHKLNLSVGSLMEAGEFTIKPQDTLEDLQTLMNSSNWGQIPVVDPDSEEVIGIVTRTDLIKTMFNGQAQIPQKQNLASRLEDALPASRLALLRMIADRAHSQQLRIYIVGGFVRDLLLERPSLDFDLVIEGDAISLAHSLQKEFGGKVVSHGRFGTAKWKIGAVREKLTSQLPAQKPLKPDDFPENVDLISARTEFYEHPTALPTVEHSSIKLDLHRRDFSINTMALRLDSQHYGDLYDYWGGLNDLNRGHVRVLHSLSFVDDPTRLLRAVRFEQRFNFKIENRTLQLMEEAHALLNQVSGDRIRHELDLILEEENFPAMLSRLEELHLLYAIHPDLKWSDDISKKIAALLRDEPDPAWGLPQSYRGTPTQRILKYLVWLIHIPPESIPGITKRLRLSSKLTNLLSEAHFLMENLPGMTSARPSQFVQYFENVSLVTLYTFTHLDFEPQIINAIQDYIFKWQEVKPFTTGEDLKNRNIAPGPTYRKILETLRTAWLDGTINSREDENRLLASLIENIQITGIKNNE